jgi:phage-related minor tail protein
MRTAAKITRELHDVQRKMMIANSPRLLAALKHRAKALSTELALTVGTLSLGVL